MATISLTITASTEEILSGIPRYITVAANISSTIFYTLDGSIPTVASAIYTVPIELPTNQTIVVLSLYATNGIDSSPVIVNTYELDIIGPSLRQPHSGTDAASYSTPQNNLYPFGTPPVQPGQNYLGIGNAGFTTDNPLLTEYPTGYDGDGYATGFTNEQLIGVPTKTQPIKYSVSNFDGIQGDGIGTFPPFINNKELPAPEQSTFGNKLFNPKSLVIYQDLTQPQDIGLPAMVMSNNFTLEDVNHTRQGNQYFNTALDAPPVSGSFVRAERNGVTNTTTYYYFDNSVSRWIIIKAPSPPNAIKNYASSMVFRRDEEGSNFVFQWIPFKSTYLA